MILSKGNEFLLRPIGEVARIVAGKTPKGIASKEFSAIQIKGSIPFYKVGDMNNSPVTISESRTWLTLEEIEASNLRTIPIGSVIFPKAGGAIATNKKRIIGLEGAIDLNCMAIIPSALLHHKFLYFWMESLDLSAFSNGSILPQISKGTVEVSKIPVPSFSEQERIVEVLEDHLSRLDAAVTDVDLAKRKAAAFRRSVLNAGMSGYFSEASKDLDSRFPRHWKLVTLAEVAKWTSGGTPASSNPKFYDGDIPWVVIGDLTESVVSETTKKISSAGLDGSSAKILPEGTVMLAMYGASIGRTGFMGKPMSTNQAIACGTVHEDKILKEFLLYFLQSQKQDFIYAGKGGAQPNISQGVVKEWPIALPPLKEQAEIVSEIERQLSYLDSSQRMTEQIKSGAENFRRSLLQAAFTGQLTKEEVNV